MSTPAQTEVNKIFGLIEEKKTKESIDLTASLLESKDQNVREVLINNLSKIYDKNPAIIKTLIPKILDNLNEEDDLLRYSMVLAMKPICDQDPNLILPFYHDFIKDNDANKRESIIRLVGFIAREHPDAVKEYIPDLISALADEKEFVQDQAVETLKILGRTASRELEPKMLAFLGPVTNVDIKKKGETVLKSFVQVATLEKEQLETKEINAKSKELEMKQKELEKKEQELKAKEL
jgi:HEAT repeat protein